MARRGAPEGTVQWVLAAGQHAATGAVPAHGACCAAAGPRRGGRDEQFLRRHCRLPHHRRRRAVRRSLFHRLERLSRRVRGGGLAPARAARCGSAAPSTCTCCRPPISASRRCASPTPPSTSRSRFSGPTASPSSSSVPPMFRGVVEANEIEFQRPVLRLALDEQGRLELAELRPGAGQSRLPARQRRADLAQDHRWRAGGARPRRRRAHAPRGLERRAVGAGAGRALPLPRHLRHGRRRARDPACRRPRPEADGTVRFKAIAAARATSARPTRWTAASLDLMGKPRIDGELTARLPIAGLWQPPAARQRRVARQEARSTTRPSPTGARRRST